MRTRRSSRAPRNEPPILLVKWYDVTKWLLDRFRGCVDRAADAMALPDAPRYTDFQRMLREARCDAVLFACDPPMDVYKTEEMTAPAIVAAESARQGGRLLEVPDLGRR